MICMVLIVVILRMNAINIEISVTIGAHNRATYVFLFVLVDTLVWIIGIPTY